MTPQMPMHPHSGLRLRRLQRKLQKRNFKGDIIE